MAGVAGVAGVSNGVIPVIKDLGTADTKICHPVSADQESLVCAGEVSSFKFHVPSFWSSAMGQERGRCWNPQAKPEPLILRMRLRHVVTQMARQVLS